MEQANLFDFESEVTIQSENIPVPEAVSQSEPKYEWKLILFVDKYSHRIWASAVVAVATRKPLGNDSVTPHGHSFPAPPCRG